MSRKTSKRRQRPAPAMPLVLQRRPLRAVVSARAEDDRAVPPEAAQTPAPLDLAPATGRADQ
jgi:hypothetical protein